MRATEFVTEEIVAEGATSVLYHYTGTPNALRILQSGVFELSSVTGNRSEEQYAPKGYPYFFSTTRSRINGNVSHRPKYTRTSKKKTFKRTCTTRRDVRCAK